MVLVITLILLLSAKQTGAQSAVGSDHETSVYAALPAGEREGFITALDKIVTLEKRRNWEGVYEWLDKEELIDGKKNISKETFVRKTRQTILLDFATTGVYYIAPERAWKVIGCAAFYRLPPFADRHRGGIVSSISARRTPEGWRFSAPPAIVIDEDSPGGTRGCTISH